MLERAIKAKVPLGWVTADAVYGGDRNLRQWLEEQEQPFVMAVACNEPLWYDWGRGPEQVTAEKIAAKVKAGAWQRLSCGEGTKGPRLYDWALVKLARWRSGKWGHWLLVRCTLSEPYELTYYVVFAPVQTSVNEMVQVVGERWRVEENFESAKGEVGLDHYQVRHWYCRYRFVTLAMVAHAYLSVTRYYTNFSPAEKKGIELEKEKEKEEVGQATPLVEVEGRQALTEGLIPLSVPEIRRLLDQLGWDKVYQPALVIGWSRWRRRQQARAKTSHYKRQLTAFKT
jgi:SRSO17 transposase